MVGEGVGGAPDGVGGIFAALLPERRLPVSGSVRSTIGATAGRGVRVFDFCLGGVGLLRPNVVPEMERDR